MLGLIPTCESTVLPFSTDRHVAHASEHHPQCTYYMSGSSEVWLIPSQCFD